MRILSGAAGHAPVRVGVAIAGAFLALLALGAAVRPEMAVETMAMAQRLIVGFGL